MQHALEIYGAPAVVFALPMRRPWGGRIAAVSFLLSLYAILADGENAHSP